MPFNRDGLPFRHDFRLPGRFGFSIVREPRIVVIYAAMGLSNMRRTIPTWGLSIGVLLACGSAGRLYAVGRTAAVSGYWTNAATWPVTGIPANNDDVTINSGVAVTADVSTASLNSLNVGGTLVFSGWNTAITSTTVTISDTVTHPPQSTTETNPAGPWVPDNRVWFVCSNLTVSSGAKINVDGKGYQGVTPDGSHAAQGRGPGGGPVSDWAGGGGYGGRGGRASNTTPGGTNYGSASAPTDPGSSGGSAYGYSAAARAGNGGGSVRIDASGRVTVDGLISANGDDGPGSSYTSSGSSGGGIYITCRSFTGSGGIIRSIGGVGPNYSGRTGGGAGGRVAVVYDVAEQSNAPTPSVSFNVGGGLSGPSLWFEYAGTPYGEPGTLYLTDSRFFPTNVIASSFSLLTPNTTNWTMNSLTCSDAWVRLPAGCAMTVSNNLTVIGNNAIVELPAPAWLTCGGNLVLTNGGRLYLSSGPTNGMIPDYGGGLSVGGTLSVSTGSILYAACDPTNGGALKMTVGTLALRSGGAVSADGRGYRGWVTATRQGLGPGGGVASDVGSGAGYGGAGSGNQRGNVGGVTYGSSNAPLDAGSVGGNGAAYTGGGYGGGVVRLAVLDRATVDGTISASGWRPIEQNPINGYACGGGSGGSIWITTPRFFGSGWLRADGGDAGSYVVPPRGPGGGGGGRIAVWRTIGTPYPTSVTGGVGFAQAGDGTVVWGNVPAVGTVIVLR